MSGVRTLTDRTHAVDGVDPCLRREVSVRTTADRDAVDRETQFSGD